MFRRSSVLRIVPATLALLGAVPSLGDVSGLTRDAARPVAVSDGRFRTALPQDASTGAKPHASGQTGDRSGVSRGAADGGIAGAPDCGPLSYTQSTNPLLIQPLTAPYCDFEGSSRELSYGRQFVAPETIALQCVTFGIQDNVGGPWPTNVRIKLGTIEAPYDSLLEVGSAQVSIPEGTSQQLFTATFLSPGIVLSAGETFVVELEFPDRLPAAGGDGGIIIPGANSFGESAPSYIRSASCNAPDFLPLAAAGFPNVHLVMTLGAQPADAGGVSLSQAEPSLHPEGGGSTIFVYGTNFEDGQRVRIGGEELVNAHVDYATRISGVVPGLAAGSYDLTIESSTGELLAALPGAVTYVETVLPGPQDVSVVRSGDEVELRWSNVIVSDFVEIRRGGSLIAKLSGDSQFFLDDVRGIPEEATIGYTITGGVGGSTTVPAGVEVSIDPCAILQAAPAANSFVIAPTLKPLPGLGLVEAQAPAIVTGVLQAMQVRVLAKYLEGGPGGQLRARIRPLSAPQTIVADNIVLTPTTGQGSDATWLNPAWMEGVALVALPPGNYIVGFYVQGGSVNVSEWALALDATAQDLGEPWPCPQYPIAQVTPICFNFPPSILDIERVFIPAVISSDSGPQISFTNPLWSGPDIGGVAGFKTIANDPDGSIVSYAWSFNGTGCNVPNTAVSASPSIFHPFCATDPDPLVVTVTVTDNGGKAATFTKSFKNKPLTAPPGPGLPPIISTFSPTDRAFLPKATVAANQTFQFFVTPASGDTVTSMTVQLRDQNGLVVASSNATPTVPSDPDPAKFWQVTFNMSQPALKDQGETNAVVRVIATTQQNQATKDHFVKVCTVPFYYEYPFVGVASTYDASKNEYVLSGSLPKLCPSSPVCTPGTFCSPFYDCPVNVPIVGTLDNKFDARLTNQLRLLKGDWIPDNVAGYAEVKLLNKQLFHKQFAVDLQSFVPGQISLPCDQLCLNWTATDLQIFASSWNWPIYNGQVYNGFVGPVPVKVTAAVDVGLGIDLDLEEVDATLCISGPPYLQAEAEFLPVVSTWINAQVTASILYGLGKLTVTATPQLTISIPVTLTVVDLATSATVDICAELKVTGKVKACIAKKCWESSTITVVDTEFPSGCAFPALAVAGGEDPFGVLRTPAIATSPDGTRSLMVYVQETSQDNDPTTSEPALYFAVDNGSGFGPNQPIFAPAGFTPRQPSVAFLSNTTAVAVWMESSMTLGQELANQTPATVGNVFASFDIFYAIWDSTLGWGPRVALQQDIPMNGLYPDGAPIVASTPGTPGSAWVVWVRSELQNMIDPVTGPELTSLSVWGQRIQNSVPSGPAVKISAGDEANPAADIEPWVALAPQGNAAYAVWTRDLDGDFTTNDDRFVMASAFNGTLWSAPQAVSDPRDNPGALMPAIVLSGPSDGVLAFTSRAVDPETGNSAGVGNLDIAQASLLVGGSFTNPQPISNPRCDPIPTAFAAYPLPVLLGEDLNTAAIVFRDVTGFGTDGGDGELAISTLQLNRKDAGWSAARRITEDASLDWEIAAVGSNQSLVRTVRVCAAGNPANDFLVHQDIACDATIGFEALRVSDAFAPAGSQIELTASLRNDGLCPPRGAGLAKTLRFGTVEDGAFVERAAIPILFTSDPDGVESYAITLPAPARTTIFRAILEPGPGETGESTSVDSVFGVPAPDSVSCDRFDDEEATGVGLRWTNPIAYDEIRVLRDGVLIERLDGTRHSYFDTGIYAAKHRWTVQGRVGRAWSHPSLAECDCCCPADLTGDGVVDGADLGALLGDWGVGDIGDLTGDGQTDGADLGVLLGAWGQCG